METLKIIPQEGYEVDKEKSTFEEIVFKKIESKFPKTWLEAIKDKKITGYFVDPSSYSIRCNIANERDAATFPTFEEAEASIALAQLCVLRDIYNGEPLADWADWTNPRQAKYCICFFKEEITKNNHTYVRTPLALKTEELYDEFIKNFKDLIIKAKPLL